MSCTLVYATYPNDAEGKKAASALIESRLAACVAILPGVTSVYRWEGEVRQDAEVVLFVKTDAKIRQKVIDFMVKNHPYKVPCVLAMEVVDGHMPYLAWVQGETAGT